MKPVKVKAAKVVKEKKVKVPKPAPIPKQTQSLDPNEITEFPWEERWCKAHEYEHMLKNINQYCDKFDFKKLDDHPANIYTKPECGQIYFHEGNTVEGRNFGFPAICGCIKEY